MHANILFWEIHLVLSFILVTSPGSRYPSVSRLVESGMTWGAVGVSQGMAGGSGHYDTYCQGWWIISDFDHWRSDTSLKYISLVFSVNRIITEGSLIPWRATLETPYFYLIHTADTEVFQGGFGEPTSALEGEKKKCHYERPTLPFETNPLDGNTVLSFSGHNEQIQVSSFACSHHYHNHHRRRHPHRHYNHNHNHHIFSR